MHWMCGVSEVHWDASADDTVGTRAVRLCFT